MYIFSRHIPSRAIVVLLATAALALFVTGRPAPAAAFEVVVLKSGDYKPYADALRAFTKTCNCDVTELKSDDDLEETLREKKPDAVMAIGTNVFKKVKSIRDLPVIYTMAISSEVAPPLPQNISGVSMDISPETYLAAMAEVFPNAKRIGLLYDPRHTSTFAAEAAQAARAAGLKLVAKEVHDPTETAALLNKMYESIDVFWMLPDPTVVTAETVDYLLRLSFERNLPVFSFSKKYVEMGAVAALNINPSDMGAQAGEIVDRLAKGNPGPIRAWARSSRLTINAKVAAKMGLKINEDVMKKAEKVE